MTKKIYTDREFDKLLRNNGYCRDHTTGSHTIYKNGGQTISVNRNLNRMVARRLIKQHRLG